MIHGLNHFTILAADRRATLDFYVGVLGLAEGPRPDFDFPGSWLYAAGGGPAILHVVYGRALPEPPAGVIDHMAFSATGLAAVTRRLDEHGVGYDLRRLPGGGPGGGPWQLFCHDPNGARVELDFDAAERP
jgi:catechol 2,3-dioxygenase-like lactoylglutathione lyase family enzyme